MFNHVTVTYTDVSDTVQTSAASTQDQSIAKFGRREDLLTLDGLRQATAEARRDAYLLENAWPWARAVGMSANDKTTSKYLCADTRSPQTGGT